MFGQALPLSTSSCPAIVELSLYFQFRSCLVSVRVTHIGYGRVASACGWTQRSWDLSKWPGKEAIAASYSGVKVCAMAYFLHWFCCRTAFIFPCLLPSNTIWVRFALFSRCHFSLSFLSNKPSLAWKQPQSHFATVSNWLPSALSPPVIQIPAPW